MLICKFCGKECKNDNSLRNHERTCPSNKDRVYKNGMLGKRGKRSGNQYTKAKELGIPVYGTLSSETRARMAEASRNRVHTQETKDKLSKIAKERGLGGHTSKTRLYFKKKTGEEVYLQSSYELLFAEILEELNIEWCRPAPLIWVDDAGDTHRYYPDFKVGEKYFDTKNDYLAIKDAEKISKVSQQNNVVVEIVRFNDINREYIQRALIVK